MKNSVTHLDHVNFTVNNFQESVDWYKEIFNFDLVEEGIGLTGQRWGILKSGDTMLAITEYPEWEQPEAEDHHKIYHFGFRLRDKEEWQEKLNEHKLETYFASPIDYPHSTSWYVRDPTGNSIEVSIWDNNTVRFDSPQA